MSYYTQKIHPGADFPVINLPTLDGTEVEIGKPSQGFDWRLVVVYRGRHCPMCTKYLNQLTRFVEQLKDIKVDLIAVSGDSKAQLESHMASLEINFPVAYGLSTEQMKALGAYISDPRSPEETDHPFAEPALYVINENGQVQVVDISNNPFVRPDLATLTRGLGWIKDPSNNYPIRGMHN